MEGDVNAEQRVDPLDRSVIAASGRALRLIGFGLALSLLWPLSIELTEGLWFPRSFFLVVFVAGVLWIPRVLVPVDLRIAVLGLMVAVMAGTLSFAVPESGAFAVVTVTVLGTALGPLLFTLLFREMTGALGLADVSGRWGNLRDRVLLPLTASGTTAAALLLVGIADIEPSATVTEGTSLTFGHWRYHVEGATAAAGTVSMLCLIVQLVAMMNAFTATRRAIDSLADSPASLEA